MADDAERMQLAKELQAGSNDFQQAPWWYRNAHMLSPGGLMQEGLFQAGLGQTGPGYDMLKRMGGAADSIMGVLGALPLAGRAVLGRAGMAGHDASMADYMMRNAPEDVLYNRQGVPFASGVSNPTKTMAPGGGPWKTVMPGHKFPTQINGIRSDVAKAWTTPEGTMPGGYGIPVNQNSAAMAMDQRYQNELLAQQLRKGFEVVK